MKLTHIVNASLFRTAFYLVLALGICPIAQSTAAADGRLVDGGIDAPEEEAASMPATQCPAMLAYIANLDSNDVSVIDTSNDARLTDVPVGELPWGVAIR